MEQVIKSRMVPLEKLRWNCDPDTLGVTGTLNAQKLQKKVIAQERAVSALQFGMKMKGNDYNIYVAGEARTGLTYLTRTFLEEAAAVEERPPDWCYAHNFNEPDKPAALELPAGRANELSQDMDELVESLKNEIPKIFESEDYRHRRDEALKRFTTSRNEILSELEKKVQEAGFILNLSQQGMMIVPGKDGVPITEEDLKELTDEQKEELRERSVELHEEMNAAVAMIKKLEKGLKDLHKDLHRRVALHAVGFRIDELQKKYAGIKPVLSYLLAVKNDVIKNLGDFLPQEQAPSPIPVPQHQADHTRYKINVIVDNSETEGAPVVIESNPTYTNLFGSMERKAHFGTLFTDFTMITTGSLHKANGGYLVVQARDLLKWYISWEALKRALKNQEIKIEDTAEMFGLIAAKGIKPTPIPLRVKIILIGEPYLYHLLYAHDDQFKKLFKVKAHLDDEVDRTPEELLTYVSFAARCVEQCRIRHVDKTGLSRLLEYGVEVAGRQKKLTLKMAQVMDILRESDYWAAEDNSEFISRPHVDQAVRQKKFRSSLPEEKMRQIILDGYINVTTIGSKVGQINGLSVYMLGDYSFGGPSRISSSISMGRAGVVAIDRESKLSGNIHTKGILIMEGYLRGRYALNRPLSLSASLVFEQSYGMVDGDSASAAELFALLSQLTNVPLKQSLAVTGAISQLGEVQPIGGVNQKIEGFFEVCQAGGLTGEQGVIIPEANVPDLMLKGQVVDAVRKGLFTVYAVNNADEALEILTGMPAGQRDAEGVFPEGTFNRLVEDKLQEMAEAARKFVQEDKDKKTEDNDEAGVCDTCDN